MSNRAHAEASASPTHTCTLHMHASTQTWTVCINGTAGCWRLGLQRKKSSEIHQWTASFKALSPLRGPKDSLRTLLSNVEIISANEKSLVMTQILYVQMLSEPTQCGPHSDVQTICTVLPYIITGKAGQLRVVVGCTAQCSTGLTLTVMVPVSVLVIALHDIFPLFIFSLFLFLA